MCANQGDKKVNWTLMIVLCLLGLGTCSACKPPEQESPSKRQATKPATTQPADDSDRDLPRTDERRKDRLEMVREDIAGRGIEDHQVLEAMRHVPRHWFVPEGLRRMAYADRPLPIGHGQTISQPYIVALMTEALRLKPDSKVLEIGTGSGYQAAVLAEITPHVYTIEIVEPLGRRAIEVFKQRGYDDITAKVGDGYKGWPEYAPFDAIIVTCAPEEVPPKLTGQLKPGGRMCIPVGRTGAIQELVRITKQDDGTVQRESLLPVSFVPMTGENEEK